MVQTEITRSPSRGDAKGRLPRFGERESFGRCRRLDHRGEGREGRARGPGDSALHDRGQVAVDASHVFVATWHGVTQVERDGAHALALFEAPMGGVVPRHIAVTRSVSELLPAEPNVQPRTAPDGVVTCE